MLKRFSIPATCNCFSVPYEHYQSRVESLIHHNERGISFLMYAQKWLPAKYWKYAAKHFVRVRRFVSTLKTGHSTPAFMIGAGNLDFSVQFPFAFGDFVAVPDVEKRWKFDMRKDLGIYLGDADDTKRGFLNPSTGAVQVRLDCVKQTGTY